VGDEVIASIPIGQSTQALVYVPGAVAEGVGTDKLVPLGQAGNTTRLRLVSSGITSPNAQASVAVNSLGLVDLVQIAASGLSPNAQYQVYLTESARAPFASLEPLAVIKTNPDGAGIVQTIGPLKTLSTIDSTATARRYLIVTKFGNSSDVVLHSSDERRQ